MMQKLQFPVFALACLCLLAELFHVPPIDIFGAIVSICGMAISVLQWIAARSRENQKNMRISLIAFVLYLLAFLIQMFGVIAV